MDSMSVVFLRAKRTTLFIVIMQKFLVRVKDIRIIEYSFSTTKILYKEYVEMQYAVIWKNGRDFRSHPSRYHSLANPAFVRTGHRTL